MVSEQNKLLNKIMKFTRENPKGGLSDLLFYIAIQKKNKNGIVMKA